MKATGIVRTVDELGRIVLPIELRRTMGIQDKDPLEISVDEGCILLTKYQPSCVFCGETADVILFRGKNVCPACRRAPGPSLTLRTTAGPDRAEGPPVVMPKKNF